MSNLKAFSAVLAAATTLASSALARGGDQSWLSVAVTRTSNEGHYDDGKAETVVTVANVGAAYGVGSGLGLGLKVFDYTVDDGDDDDDTYMKISGWGPMVGYLHDSGFYVQGSYLMQPTKEFKDDNAKVSYEGGSGYVLDAGKMWEFGGRFGAGVALAKSHVAYKKVKAGSTTTDLDGTWWDESLYPYAVLFILF